MCVVLAVLAAVFVLASASAVMAEQALATVDYQGQVFWATLHPHEFQAPTSVRVGGVPGGFLFEDLVLTPADQGVLFEANHSNDPDFATYASTLTNGTSDDVYFGPWWGDTEQTMLLLQTVDLLGYQIDRVTMRPTLLDFQDADGRTTLNYIVHFVVWGTLATVPAEPTTWSAIKAAYSD